MFYGYLCVVLRRTLFVWECTICEAGQGTHQLFKNLEPGDEFVVVQRFDKERVKDVSDRARRELGWERLPFDGNLFDVISIVDNAVGETCNVGKITLNVTTDFEYVYVVKLPGGVYKVGRTSGGSGTKLPRVNQYAGRELLYLIRVGLPVRDFAEDVEYDVIQELRSRFSIWKNKLEYFEGGNTEDYIGTVNKVLSEKALRAVKTSKRLGDMKMLKSVNPQCDGSEKTIYEVFRDKVASFLLGYLEGKECCHIEAEAVYDVFKEDEQRMLGFGDFSSRQCTYQIHRVFVRFETRGVTLCMQNHVGPRRFVECYNVHAPTLLAQLKKDIVK